MSGNMEPSQSLEDTTASTSKDSKASLLSKRGEEPGLESSVAGGVDKEEKPRKRDFFRFGKKTEEDKKSKNKSPVMSAMAAAQLGAAGGLRPVSPLAGAASMRSTGSPPRAHPYNIPASPGQQRLQSASPRTHSPSTSQIFERSVQEDVMPPQASPQIPSHIITENHIPPALDASSEAITDSKLDPDTVEIVTHANHQPAAASIAGATDQSMASSTYEDFASHISRQDTDNVSNYGSLDVGDVRRLSFISFADVVHAEQEMGEQRRDSGHLQSLGTHPALAAPRSPSPIRSPTSSQALGTSPSASTSPLAKGMEVSPSRGIRGAGSPLPGQSSPLATNELNIETMRQALRKTGSGDLSGFRSGPVSSVGADEGSYERSLR